MEKATVNTHLNHLEDNVFLGGIDGTRDSIRFLQKFRDLLQGRSTRRMNTSVKWDGAPAIWMGNVPGTERFFIAKKSLFNKVPLYYESINDIERTTDLSNELKKKFKLAFNMYKDVKFTNILQGDFLFDADDLKTTTVDGVKYVTFHPNTIAYSIPADSDLANILKKKKMGIVFHTTYSGSTIKSLSATAGAILPKAPEAVWQIDADFKDMQGSASLTRMETSKIDRHMSMIGQHFRMVDKNAFDILNDPIMAAFCTTYTNAFIRANKTPTPEEAAEGLGEFIMQKFKTEMDKLKTPAGKQRRMDAMKAVIGPLASIPGHQLVSVFHLYYGLQTVKNIIIKKLNSSGFIKTFIKTSDGWKVTGQEGYVATDSLGKNSIKLVDRLEFSYANFSKDVIKGWESDLRK
tara:strand:- start:67 stop:1281 length:1215 start_codon:yes stop_codon:yes gene_type:complete